MGILIFFVLGSKSLTFTVQQQQQQRLIYKISDQFVPDHLVPNVDISKQ